MARAAEKGYPSEQGWSLRVYHDADLKNKTIKDLMCNISCSHGNVDFCDMRLLTPPASMYYDKGSYS